MARIRDLFLRALGGVYLIAFASLRTQVKGLLGARGIRPVTESLERARARLPRNKRLRRLPTLFWLGSSDAALVRACQAGELGSIAMMLGIAPRLTATGLWALYLSFVTVGREFLMFQWDALLLESGLHAIIVAPSRRRERPTWVAIALMRWLAFRLQFESGHYKLESGDPTWRNGDACVVHFETQPLPTRLGWHAHHAPRPWKRAATFATLAIELALPWLAFAPRRLRRKAFVVLCGLQVMIAATGNYGFFNVLTVVDNLWLLDERSIRTRSPSLRRRITTAVAATPIAALSASVLHARLFPERASIPAAVARLHEAIAPLHSVNAYGLFAMMTTDRPEIIVEGSDDGTTWREYSFRYKPGDVRRAPRWVAPHQPRLDWQMWFAALGAPPAWFLRFLHRLLDGSPDVLALLDEGGNPFPDGPPRYVRALLYDYHFSDPATRRQTGQWWRRELLGTYVPPIAMSDPSARSSS